MKGRTALSKVVVSASRSTPLASLTPREYYLYNHVKNNPGINSTDLERAYNSVSKHPVNLHGDILRMFGRGLFTRGKSRTRYGQGLYVSTRESKNRDRGGCAWCGKLSQSYYCPEHKLKRQRNDANRAKSA